MDASYNIEIKDNVSGAIVKKPAGVKTLLLFIIIFFILFWYDVWLTKCNFLQMQ